MRQESYQDPIYYMIICEKLGHESNRNLSNLVGDVVPMKNLAIRIVLIDYKEFYKLVDQKVFKSH